MIYTRKLRRPASKLPIHKKTLMYPHDLFQQLVMFELSGPAEGYVAFALSYDTWMVSWSRWLSEQVDVQRQ